MSNGLALTRQVITNKNEIVFSIEAGGETITVKQTFVSVKGQQVRVDIKAPDRVKISRGELLNTDRNS